MDLKSFLESGLLEAYVLGQCTDAERAEVERMAAEHVEVRAELEAIEQALEKVAMANAVPPPAGLRDRVLHNIQHPMPEIPVRNIRWTPWLGWLVAALLLIGIAVEYFRGTQDRMDLKGQIAALETQLEDCKNRTAGQERLQELIALLRDRNTQSVVLSDGPEPKLTATVWHNPVRRTTVLDINSLPAPAPGKYFQFWAIVDGQPVSMGMVQLRGADSWQTLPYIAEASAFAISAEDNPEGNPTPTAVVLIGNV